ncbi:hypothetical protein BDR26DRAFT_1004061 [Obelidium mucronatum]|nr:hypothetical protein BDR26DRAFT_1004061 [Obelidium mucronatum]
MSPKPQSSNYVAKAAESVSCSDSEGTAPSKRKRPAVEDLEQMSKAERRRTQIRLAQRAYRDRQSQYVKQLEAELNALKGNGGRSPRNTPPAPLAASAGPPHATAKLEEEREILGKQLKEA